MSSTLHIVGVSAGPDGSGYHRMFLPFKHLKDKSRHWVEGPPAAQPPMPTRQDMLDLKVDVLVMQRPVGPAGRQMWDDLDGACARVYEIDDDLLHPESSGLAALCDARIKETIEYMLWRSDMITVSTPYLAQEFSRFSDEIVVLENVINEDLLRMERTRRDRVTVGWGGGASHLIDLCAVQDPLNAVLDANPQADIHFIGVDYGPLLHGRPYRWTMWHADVWDFYKAYDFDIAICPLADVKFNRSKSFLKALDAAARGVPVVASDMEPYRDFVVDGKTGYLVRTADQWRARLHELINDEAAREELGRNAKAAAQEWTIQKRWPLWEKSYERAAGIVRPARL